MSDSLSGGVPENILQAVLIDFKILQWLHLWSFNMYPASPPKLFLLLTISSDFVLCSSQIENDAITLPSQFASIYLTILKFQPAGESPTSAIGEHEKEQRKITKLLTKQQMALKQVKNFSLCYQ